MTRFLAAVFALTLLAAPALASDPAVDAAAALALAKAQQQQLAAVERDVAALKAEVAALKTYGLSAATPPREAAKLLGTGCPCHGCYCFEGKPCPCGAAWEACQCGAACPGKVKAATPKAAATPPVARPATYSHSDATSDYHVYAGRLWSIPKGVPPDWTRAVMPTAGGSCPGGVCRPGR